MYMYVYCGTVHVKICRDGCRAFAAVGFVLTANGPKTAVHTGTFGLDLS